MIAWFRPISDLIDSFLPLENILWFLDNEGLKTIILGDKNCNFGPENESKYDLHATRFNEIYKTFYLKQIIIEPNREALSTATTIDQIETKAYRNIVESWVVPISLSQGSANYGTQDFFIQPAETFQFTEKITEMYSYPAKISRLHGMLCLYQV